MKRKKKNSEQNGNGLWGCVAAVGFAGTLWSCSTNSDWVTYCLGYKWDGAPSWMVSSSSWHVLWSVLLYAGGLGDSCGYSQYPSIASALYSAGKAVQVGPDLYKGSAGCGECYVVTDGAGVSYTVTVSHEQTGKFFSAGDAMGSPVFQGAGMPAGTWKLIPCPLAPGTSMSMGMTGFDTNAFDGKNLRLTITNHLVGIVAVTAIVDAAPVSMTRSITNEFIYSNAVPIYGTSPTKTFTLTIQSFDGEGVTCTASFASLGTAPSGSKTVFALSGPGGTPCQFSARSIVTNPCGPPNVPPLLYGSQVYGFDSPGSFVDCLPGSSGCQARFEGPFMREMVVLSFGRVAAPNYTFTGDCPADPCIDLGVSVSNFVFLALKFFPQIVAAYTQFVSISFEAKCAQASCSVLVQFVDCPAWAGATFLANQAWQTFSTPLNTVLAACPNGIQLLQFQASNNPYAPFRLLLDNIQLQCTGACPPVTQPTPTFIWPTDVLVSADTNLTAVGSLHFTRGSVMRRTGRALLLATETFEGKDGTLQMAGNDNGVVVVAAATTLSSVFASVEGCTDPNPQQVVQQNGQLQLLTVNCTSSASRTSVAVIAGASVAAVVVGVGIAVGIVIAIKIMIAKSTAQQNAALREESLSDYKQLHA